jgi:integrase
MCYTPDGALKPIRRSTGKKNMKDAEAVLDAVNSEMRTGTYKSPEVRAERFPLPFEVVVESYLEDRSMRGKRTDSYRKLKDWVAVCKGRDIRELTLDLIEKQLAAWKSERGWSDATYNNALSQISGVFTYAYRKWKVEHPLRGRAERIQVSNGRERYFYPHEVTAVGRTARALARLKKQPLDWLSNINAGAPFTGLRRGNFCNLRVRDVRRDEAGELWLRVGRSKNGDPIEKRVVGRIHEIVEARVEGALPAAHLFPGPHGGTAYHVVDDYLKVVVEHVGKRHKDWGLKWGLKEGGVTFHSYRHAMASLALNAGVPRDVIKKMGGWKTDVMVNRYAHRADQHLRDGEDKLAEVLGFSTAKVKQLHSTAQSQASDSSDASKLRDLA